ncbi:MAG: phage terminase large subunit family protein [Proteobacteria bacterium]|nr:phage terminase large subunit family protein [Pseudomonadota bacterium]
MLIEIPAVDIQWDPCITNEWHDGLGFETLSFAWEDAEREAFAPPPDITVSEYADQDRVLQAGVSRNPGQWRTDYTPYLRQPMDSYNLEHVRHIILCFGTQLGKTEFLYNILHYIIGHDPYSTLLMYPREDDAKSISRTRVQPMIDDCPDLRAKKPEQADLYQTLEMHFPAMVLHLVGANSLAAIAQKSCRNILRDELDKYPKRLGKDADPHSKSAERAKSYWDIRKEVDVSSPTFKKTGILRQIDRCHVVYILHHPCPHCGKLLKLDFKQIQWDDRPEDPDRIMIAKQSAHYICQKCERTIDNGHRARMIADCKYVADRKIDYLPERIGFWASSLSSPILTWGEIAEAFLEAMREMEENQDKKPLQTFVNDWLAKAWEEKVVVAKHGEILKARVSLPGGMVPEKAVALTAGVDVQKHGFWYVVRAWAADYTSWLIDYGELETWEDVDHLLFSTRFQVQDSERTMGICRAGVDTGGGKSQWSNVSTTEETYLWLRRNRLRPGIRVYGVKGASRPQENPVKIGQPFDKTPSGKALNGSLRIYTVDTEYYKDLYHERLQAALGEVNNAVPAWLSADTDEDYARQIAAEEKQEDENGVASWVRISNDNHYFDCEDYAMAVASPQWPGGGIHTMAAMKPKRQRRVRSTGITV